LYRQARLLGVLLLLQVIAMVALGAWLFANIDWSTITNLSNEPGQVRLHTDDKETLRHFERAIVYTIYFFAPMVLLLLAGLGFALLRRRGWMLASVGQALIMLACLFYYGASRPWFAYPIIVYCILMILLLNSRSVRAVVGRRRLTPVEPRPEIARGE
jgi:p-aminobenzoyl-glutamate transporter AbgT